MDRYQIDGDRSRYPSERKVKPRFEEKNVMVSYGCTMITTTSITDASSVVSSLTVDDDDVYSRAGDLPPCPSRIVVDSSQLFGRPPLFGQPITHDALIRRADDVPLRTTSFKPKHRRVVSNSSNTTNLSFPMVGYDCSDDVADNDVRVHVSKLRTIPAASARKVTPTRKRKSFVRREMRYALRRLHSTRNNRVELERSESGYLA